MNEKQQKNQKLYLKDDEKLLEPKSPLAPLLWFGLLMLPIIIGLAASLMRTADVPEAAPPAEQVRPADMQKAPDVRRSQTSDPASRRRGR